MSLTVFCTKFNKLKLNQCGRILSHAQRRFVSETSGSVEDEYTKEPIYPDIVDPSFRKKKERQSLSWHEEVKNLNTVEEKLLKVNMPRYYGFRNYQLNDDHFRYNCLPFLQHWTRTSFEEGIPTGYYGKTAEEENQLVAQLKDLIEEAVVFQHQGYR